MEGEELRRLWSGLWLRRPATVARLKESSCCRHTNTRSDAGAAVCMIGAQRDYFPQAQTLARKVLEKGRKAWSPAAECPDWC